MSDRTRKLAFTGAAVSGFGPWSSWHGAPGVAGVALLLAVLVGGYLGLSVGAVVRANCPASITYEMRAAR